MSDAAFFRGDRLPAVLIEGASPEPSDPELIAVARAGYANVCAYGDSAAIVAVDDLVSEVGW